MAKYFDENEKIIDILNRYPETVEFFVNKGFDKLKNEKDRDVIGKLSLNLILKTKGISIEGFSQMLDDFIELARNSPDITLNQKTKRTKGVVRSIFKVCKGTHLLWSFQITGHF